MLAEPDRGLLIGGFLGDHVKGDPEQRYPADITRGIRLHRAIDGFTDRHPRVTISKNRFRPPFRRYAGILVDVLYDHLLARDWSSYHHEPLEDFSSRVLGILASQSDTMPERAAHMAGRMKATNSLAHYGEEVFIENAFLHLGSRLKRANPMDQAMAESQGLLGDLAGDLALFFPELKEFCDEWRLAH